MKKVLNGAMLLGGKRAKVKCFITDERGYISITGEVTPYRCRTPHIFGCCHEEIAKAFPKLKKYLWLHLVEKDGSETYWIENSLYHLINGNVQAAQDILHCTDSEMLELSAVAEYGIHKVYKKLWKHWECDKDAQRIFANKVKEMGLQERRKKSYEEFIEYCNSL